MRGSHPGAEAMIWPFRNRFHEECFEALLADSHGGTFEFSPYSGEPPERLARQASSPTPPASPDAL